MGSSPISGMCLQHFGLARATKMKTLRGSNKHERQECHTARAPIIWNSLPSAAGGLSGEIVLAHTACKFVVLGTCLAHA